MSSFFQQSIKERIGKNIDRFPLIKIERTIDWQPIENKLKERKKNRKTQRRGRPSYPVLSMFKAILLGQWHSLSDPELEYSLLTRIDFTYFCNFGDIEIPDHSTLCRFRNDLGEDNTLEELLNLINAQLEEKNLKIKKADAAVIDATIIQTAGRARKKALETDDNGNIQETPASKD